MESLKTVQGRIQAIEKLEDALMQDLMKVGIVKDRNFRIDLGSSGVGLEAIDSHSKEPLFGSRVDLYLRGRHKQPVKLQISTASSGSFDLNDKASVFRIMTSSRVIENFEVVEKLLKHHTLEYKSLEDKIYAVNQK